jgi:hypothetical protein
MLNNQCLCGFARFAYPAWHCPIRPKERDSCPNRPQKPSPNFGAFLHFYDAQNSFQRGLSVIQIVPNLGPFANKI